MVLDGDKDGFISLKAINIEVLPRQTGKILLPIFQELEMLDEGQGMIDYSEFIEAALRLYQVSNCYLIQLLLCFQTLPISDRNALINFNKETKVFMHPEETFKPKLSVTKKFDVNQYIQNRYDVDEPLALEATQKSSTSQMDFYQRQ